MTRSTRRAYIPDDPPSPAEVALDNMEIAARRRRELGRPQKLHATPEQAAQAVIDEIAKANGKAPR